MNYKEIKAKKMAIHHLKTSVITQHSSNSSLENDFKDFGIDEASILHYKPNKKNFIKRIYTIVEKLSKEITYVL